MSMNDVERAAKTLATRRKQLTALARPYATQIAQIKRDYTEKCAHEIKALQRAEETMQTVLSQNETAFQEKKSATIEGIKLGWRIKPAKIECGAAAVDLILGSTDAERFLHTKLAVNKEALEALTDQQLEQIDCARIPAANTPFVDGDKVLDAYLEKVK